MLVTQVRQDTCTRRACLRSAGSPDGRRRIEHHIFTPTTSLSGSRGARQAATSGPEAASIQGNTPLAAEMPSGDRNDRHHRQRQNAPPTCPPSADHYRFGSPVAPRHPQGPHLASPCLLYTSDAADEED